MFIRAVWAKRVLPTPSTLTEMPTQTHQNNYSLLITVKKAALSFSPTRLTKLKQAWLCVRSVVDYSLAKPFTFSAKEKDLETDLNYFGSRYYNSDLSIWLSVDPMASKYPSFSPYVYCANNPVKLVDPNGETFFEVDGETKHLDDGKNGVTIHSVNHRQYKRLENSFSHNRKRYERLCDRYKNRNGYTSVSASGNDAVNEGGTIQLSEISVNYHAGKGSTASQIANTTKTAIHKLDEGGSGDCFDRKCAEKAQPYVTSGVLLLPPVSMLNNVHTLASGCDIYGKPADGIEYTLSAVGIIAHPMSFLKNPVGKCAKWADGISTGGTILNNCFNED